MKKSLRLFGLALALAASLSLAGHADCHCIQTGPAINCTLCHSAVYTAPVLQVPTPIFHTQESSIEVKIQGWEPSLSAVNLTRGPPVR